MPVAGSDGEFNPAASWIDARDGTRIHCTAWPAPASPVANVVLVHGHGEHIGRYNHIAACLSSRGHATFGFDLRGHGRSAGRRAFVDRFQRYIDDLDRVLEWVRGTQPLRPLFLLGHSMGGLIVLQYASRDGVRVQGVIASSPFITPSIRIPRPLLLFANLISRLAPALPTLDIRDRPMSHDPIIRERAEHDPLAYRGRVRARTGNEMRRAGEALHNRAGQLELPLYLFHGTADYLADWRGSFHLYGQAGSADKTLTLYRDFYHETMNEVRRDLVLDAVADWLDEHVAA